MIDPGGPGARGIFGPRGAQGARGSSQKDAARSELQDAIKIVKIGLDGDELERFY